MSLLIEKIKKEEDSTKKVKTIEYVFGNIYSSGFGSGPDSFMAYCKEKILFMWLNKSNSFDLNPSGGNYPVNCRGILCSILFEDRKNIYYANFYPNTQPVYEYTNLGICVFKDSEKHKKLIESVAKINNLKHLLNLADTEDTDLKLNLLDLKVKGMEDNLLIYQLVGPNIWVSSSPIASFMTGCLKFDCDGARMLGTDNGSLENFLNKYRESKLFTNDVEKIKEFYNWNYDINVCRGHTHNLGCHYFLNYPEKFDRKAKLVA